MGEKKFERVGGIIFNENFTEILLVKGHQAHKWGVPKGHINPDESHIECCNREVWEETGISILFCNEPVSITADKAKLYLMYAIKDRCKLDPQDKDEIMEIGWKKISDLNQETMDCTRMLKKIINRIDVLVEMTKKIRCNTINNIIII